MTSDTRKNNNSGILNTLTGFVFSVFTVLIISLLLNIIIEWLGFYFEWWKPTLEHSNTMLNLEIEQASDVVINAIRGSETNSYTGISIEFYSHYSHIFFNFVYSNIYEFTDYNISLYTDSAYNISLVFALRLIVIIFTLPLFFMLFIWGFVDGFVERDLRKFGAGRESSTLFEAARGTLIPLLIIPFVIYLSFPTYINPMFIIVPTSIFQVLIYRTLFSKYKKYI